MKNNPIPLRKSRLIPQPKENLPGIFSPKAKPETINQIVRCSLRKRSDLMTGRKGHDCNLFL
jgi:hypothetical protein